MVNRIQADVNDATAKAFEEFKKDHCMSKGVTIDRAVALYRRMFAEAQADNRIMIIDSLGNQKEIVLL